MDCANLPSLLGRCLVVVAHQDDESLYFGGLLSNITTPLKIISITAPALNRPDTNSRIDSFKKVCFLLQCQYSIYDIKDNSPDIDIYLAYSELYTTVGIIKKEIETFKPDTIITHSCFGEPNKVYPNGHMMHKMVNDAVRLNWHLQTFFCGIQAENPILFPYYIPNKKRLIDCYLPNWCPENAGYDFVYEVEKYVKA